MDGDEVRRTVAAYDAAGPAEIERRRRAVEHPRLAALREEFCAGLPPGGRVLDVGCGGGPDLARFLAAGLRAVGCEPSVVLAAVAAAAGPVVRGDARALPFAPGTFDGVWASASLLHLPKRQFPGALAEIRRVLRPRGFLYVALRHGQGERWTTERGLVRYFAHYLPGELDRYLAAAGLEVIAGGGDPDVAGRSVRWLHRTARRG